MKTPHDPNAPKEFKVSFSEAGTDPSAWRSNVEMSIWAPTFKRALELLYNAHPTAEVWNIRHTGRWHENGIIIAPEIVENCAAKEMAK